MNKESRTTLQGRSTDAVDRFVDAWRASQGSTERLSDGARDRILREAVASQTKKIPARRHIWTWAGLAASLVVAALIPAWLASNAPSAPTGGLNETAFHDSTPRILQIEAIRQDGQVVFLIANGGAAHRVTRSNSPVGSGGRSATIVDGVYVDSIDRGENLVFYRVD